MGIRSSYFLVTVEFFPLLQNNFGDGIEMSKSNVTLKHVSVASIIKLGTVLFNEFPFLQGHFYIAVD